MRFFSFFVLFILSASFASAVEVHFFYSPECHFCADQKVFNSKLEEKYGITVVNHDISDSSEARLLMDISSSLNIPVSVPFTIVDGVAFVGFDDEVARGIEGALIGREELPKTVARLPFDIDVQKYSLPVLAVVLGLADGFNPCAMWALVFLIGLVLGLRDFRKLWLLVGSFVLASGVLYFLFMTAWLNVFLLVGFFRPLTILLGVVALWAGFNSVKEFRMPAICSVPSKRKLSLMERMRKLISQPLTWASVLGVVVLAFVVNSVEFVCSSFIPAIFTQTLALHSLSTPQYYGYILLYDLFFMLDDLIIFSLAAFAVTSVGEKYSKWCRLIGGLVLLVLGFVLLFFPNLLN